jgi:hypothetical protein
MSKPKDRSTRRISPYLVIFSLVFGYIFSTNIVSPSQAPKQITAVKAEPYVWPEGCEQKEYGYGEEISSQCMKKKYLLADEYAEQLGVDTRARNYRWDSYRVGNDIIGFYPNGSSYKVKRIARDIYYQEK